ncbi:MAG: tetratricopeptide repeat protein [Candidatus Krumholzibacteria bacterium]|nr:tetratricopeptide repeat protein [Candidatus Krumholzibacteria bacterium]MDH5627145.1 tetratricopeptide repeat protein [Candidatus Krumholzibacteria bacterium]
MLRPAVAALGFTALLLASWTVGVHADASNNAYSAEVDVRLSTVRNLITARDYAAAKTMAEEITATSPALPEGWMLLGYARSVTGEFDASNAAYDAALEHGADRREVMVAKAYNCRKLGDAASTRECYREIVNLDPENVDAWMQFAAFEASVENYDDAAECYATALSMDPNNIDIIEAVSRVEEKRGNTAQAVAWLESGLSLEPTNTRLLKRLVVISLNSQDYTRTVGYADRVLAIEPDDATVQRNRALALYQKGDKTEAIESFEKVAVLDGKMDNLYGPMADCYRAAGRDGDALRVINEGIEAGSQTAWLYSVWGKILEDQKRFDEAIDKFNRAVAANDQLWSDYARKQIARQNQLKKREAMIAAQNGM